MIDWKATLMFIISIAVAYFISGGSWLVGIIAFIVIMGLFVLIDGIIIEPIVNASKPKPTSYSGGGGYSSGSSFETKILRGYSGYDVAYRIDGDKILSGYSGYDVAYRIER